MYGYRKGKINGLLKLYSQEDILVWTKEKQFHQKLRSNYEFVNIAKSLWFAEGSKIKINIRGSGKLQTKKL